MTVHLVLVGVAYAVVTLKCLRRRNADRTKQECRNQREQIAFRLPEREFYVLTHRDRHPSRAARAFLETLTNSRTAKRSRRPNV